MHIKPRRSARLLDLAMAVINHSCVPNAFAFFENSELRVRSLTRITPGEEITICYIDPTVTVFKRQEALKHDHFFVCRCKLQPHVTSALLTTTTRMRSANSREAGTRCRSELLEEKERLDRDADKVKVLHEVQTEMAKLMSSAVLAATYPGLHPAFEDRTRSSRSCSSYVAVLSPAAEWWPDHLDPMPSARLSLGMLYLGKDKLIIALRNMLKGKLLSRRCDAASRLGQRDVRGPSRYHDGGQPAVGCAGVLQLHLPAQGEVQKVACGYLLEGSARRRAGSSAETPSTPWPLVIGTRL